MNVSLGLGVVLAMIGAYFVLSGFWLSGVTRELRLLVGTEGRDLTHLTGALLRLARYHRLEMWVLIVAVAVALMSLAEPALGGVEPARPDGAVALESGA